MLFKQYPKYFFLLIFTFLTVISVNGQGIVKDSSFEAGHPNLHWVESSTNFSSTICNSLCGTVAGIEPRTGDHFVWLGGSSANPETGSVQQTVTITQTSYARLSFHLKTPQIAANFVDYLEVTLDTVVIFRMNTADSSIYKLEFQRVDIDISAFADDLSHTLKFKCYQSAVNGVSNYVIDDVSISLTAGIDAINIFDFEAFPQPANDFILLKWNQFQSIEFQVVSYDNKLIYSDATDRINSIMIDTKLWPSGFYFVLIKSGSFISRQKISVIH